MGTAAPIEIGWTVFALIGVGFSGSLILESLLDHIVVLRYVKARRSRTYNARWWLSFGPLIGNALAIVAWVGFLAIGVVALLNPPRTPDPQESSEWVGWMLIGMEGMLAALQAWYRFVRLQVVRQPPSTREDSSLHEI